jgi:hypothetical protein
MITLTVIIISCILFTTAYGIWAQEEIKKLRRAIINERQNNR